MTSFDPATAPALRRGSFDVGWVTYLQQLLTSAGYPCGIPDGDFGPTTEAAVAEFQRQAGLTATGAVEYDTWSALASGGGASQDQSAGNAWFADAGWGGESEQQPTDSEDGATGADMSYVLPEEEPLDVFGITTMLSRSATEVLGATRITNAGEHLVHDVQVTLTLTSGFGRQNTESFIVGTLPPDESVSVVTQLALMPGDTEYAMIANAVGTGALPVTATATTLIDDFRDGTTEEESESW